MKKSITFFVLNLVLFLFLFSSHNSKQAFAEATCDPAACANKSDEEKSRCLAEEINACTAKLQNTRNQEKTLKSQLDLIDGQAKVTTLKIEDTNFKIEKLEREISDLSTRIERISGTLDTLSELLLKRIVQTYKYSDTASILDLLFSSHGFADLIERLKYIQVAQAYDKKKLYELQATKLAYNDQKTDKETRQQEAEKLNKELESYKKQLADQRRAKDDLLRVTKNDEAIYQSKLQSALAEQQAILKIFDNTKNEVADGQISKGQSIGNFIVGRSACSSGTHLHFEVHKNNQLQNPVDYLANHSVSWNVSPDDPFSFNGSWDTWPINDPIEVEQGYGMTCFARPGCFYASGAYGGAPHTGIDIYSFSGSTVKAVHDGQLSHGGIACGSGTLLYKRVDHGDGISSYYLHVI